MSVDPRRRPVLLPEPRSLEWREGSHPLDARGELRLGAGPIEVREIVPGGDEAYRLLVEPARVTLLAGTDVGLFRARATLRQLVRGSAAVGAIPCLAIEDAPAFPDRGVLLDVSRDKVPTMETLYDLVDRLAEWKYNQLQLYMEHTFAYAAHPEVWKEASPLTAEEIESLDTYCRDRFIELVPNQNSFGHMERWLVHPRYAPLAETAAPETSAEEGGPPPYMSLCPVDPGSIALVASLYDELLPRFRSRRVNVGCDETLDLGQGRSREACEALGTGRVYLEFLTAIHRAAAERGRAIQFWGDIVLKYPDLIPELPRDATALAWGYEADHPFDAEGARFAASGLAYYVCPGTSSWLSIAGRTDNAVANLAAAAASGIRGGAVGYLVTDWGDHGHWQPLPVSYLGFAAGAAGAWSGSSAEGEAFVRALDVHVFRDDAERTGRLAWDLGNVYRECGVLRKNASILPILLLFPERSLAEGKLLELSIEGLDRAEAAIDRGSAAASGSAMRRPDATLVEAEFRCAADLLRHACRLGRARIESGRVGTSALRAARRRALAEELSPLVDDYRGIWLRRNRPGGLRESAGRFERLLAVYRGD